MLAYVPVALWAIIAVVAILMIIFGDEKFQAIVMAFASIVALTIAIVVDPQLAILAFIGEILIVCIPALSSSINLSFANLFTVFSSNPFSV